MEGHVFLAPENVLPCSAPAPVHTGYLAGPIVVWAVPLKVGHSLVSRPRSHGVPSRRSFLLSLFSCRVSAAPSWSLLEGVTFFLFSPPGIFPYDHSPYAPIRLRSLSSASTDDKHPAVRRARYFAPDGPSTQRTVRYTASVSTRPLPAATSYPLAG